MIVKGTKQLGNFRRGINLYVPKKRTVVLRIVISGAGTATSNGEYVWDGITIEEGKPVYDFEDFDIKFFIDYWYIYNGGADTYYYKSLDLITWTIENGEPEAPTSTLFYTP